jgi:hypothetical protein
MSLDTIVGISYPFFANKKVTPDSIREFISRMMAAFPDEKIDEEELFRKLESIHTVTIQGSLLTLDDATNHEEWFNVSTNLPIKRQFPWHFWEHLKTYLVNYKRRPLDMIESLDQLSSEIISRIEDPYRKGPWDRKGMVMGSVQSGKTSNFTALICKALDAGYRLIIVLTGLHNSLRSQTQDRLNEELLGYDLDRIQRLTGQERRIGVRRIFSDHKTVNTLTSSSQNGDFSRKVASQAGIIPSVTGDPIILIVKKNVTVLKNLSLWLNSLPGTIEANGRRVIPEIPLLLIDDECDYASVNTKQPERNENGKIVEEWDPTQTNRWIRTLLNMFERSAYVGYTATPYANIFIHKDDYHPLYGDDLFPRHFIISLPQPSNYVGPEYVFGITGDEQQGIESVEPLPLVRHIEDHQQEIPDNHKKDLQVAELPESLLEAMRAFLLVSAARRIRREGTVHNSMLVHVTRFTSVQRQLKELIERELRRMVGRILSGSDPITDFRILWEEDFVPTSERMAERGFGEAVPISWDQIRQELFEAAKTVRVKGINGEIADILDYRETDAIVRERIQNGEDVPWEERGISVIAVGGDKLSRGLTLDGLSVSYYLRASRMYDTLMQMGRWFGYREGYNDLCRIYTTEELEQWYSHIALANQELRNDLEYMALTKSTPEEFGLKVRSHPGRLVVTSAGKSRNAEKLSISYEGQFPKTIVFDPRESRNNISALTNLVNSMSSCPMRPFNPNNPRFHWEAVEPSSVTSFLLAYKTQERAKRTVDPQLIAEFIERQLTQNFLTDWHVALVSNSENRVHRCQVGGCLVNCSERKPRGNPSGELISIGTLTSPSDESLDLTPGEVARALALDEENDRRRSDGNPSSLAIRTVRPKTRALMLVYLPAFRDDKDPLKNYGLANEEVVGFAISFPRNEDAIPVDYWVNPVYLEET